MLKLTDIEQAIATGREVVVETGYKPKHGGNLYSLDGSDGEPKKFDPRAAVVLEVRVPRKVGGYGRYSYRPDRPDGIRVKNVDDGQTRVVLQRDIVGYADEYREAYKAQEDWRARSKVVREAKEKRIDAVIAKLGFGLKRWDKFDGDHIRFTIDEAEKLADAFLSDPFSGAKHRAAVNEAD